MTKIIISAIFMLLVCCTTRSFAQFPCQNGCSGFNVTVRLLTTSGTLITSKSAVLPSTLYDLEITSNSTNPIICFIDAFGFRIAQTNPVRTIDECEFGNACYDISGSIPIKVRIRTTSTYSPTTGLVGTFRMACNFGYPPPTPYRQDPDAQTRTFPPNP